MAPAGLTMAPRHPFGLVGSDKAHHAAQAPSNCSSIAINLSPTGLADKDIVPTPGAASVRYRG
jgi:hypothetical protein